MLATNAVKSCRFGLRGVFGLKHRRLQTSGRLVLAGLMVVYGAATIFVPLADSLLETAAHQTVEHFEANSPACGIGHDHLTCPLCQFISLASIAHDISLEIRHRHLQPLSNAIGEALPELARRFPPLGPRGPPLA